MDLATLLGIAMALAGILLGLAVEGGSIIQIIQPTAAMIVFGGTVGATMIGFPLSTFKRAIRDLGRLFRNQDVEPNAVIDQIVKFTNKARREGIIALEKDAQEVNDQFFRRAIMMAV